jgi:hypothetical protein
MLMIMPVNMKKSIKARLEPNYLVFRNTIHASKWITLFILFDYDQRLKFRFQTNGKFERVIVLSIWQNSWQNVVQCGEEM